jgi:hypothetical protein
MILDRDAALHLHKWLSNQCIIHFTAHRHINNERGEGAL